MSNRETTVIRPDDLLRHLQDLRTGTYEGVKSRSDKEDLYRRGIEHFTPVAVAVLHEANTLFLRNSGSVQVLGPNDDGSGGLETRYELSWPEQREAQATYGLHKPLLPVCIVVNYSLDFLHPHLSGSTAGHWPFQVTNEKDADRQKFTLAAIVELELHQRIFETDWRIFPVSL